jgi:hypothetical protein
MGEAFESKHVLNELVRILPFHNKFANIRSCMDWDLH